MNDRENVERRIRTTNAIVKRFNQHVKDATDDLNLRSLFEIDTAKDTALDRIEKQLAFFTSFGQLPPVILPDDEPKLRDRPKRDRDPNNIRIRISYSCSRTYTNGVSTGTRYSRVSHIDPNKIDKIQSIAFSPGNYKTIYHFDDGLYLSIRAATPADGHSWMNHWLQYVLDDWKLGKSEEHSIGIAPAKDAKPHPLAGTVLTATGITVTGLPGTRKVTLI